MDSETRLAAVLPAGIAVRGNDGEELARRAHAEPPHRYRSPFARDGARILHARAFRRLAGKTQVFTRRPGDPPGDHFRSRLTHTLEVTQIARTMAAALGLNTELAEALALVHDMPAELWTELRPQSACAAHRDLVRGALRGLSRVESDPGRARGDCETLARLFSGGAS